MEYSPYLITYSSLVIETIWRAWTGSLVRVRIVARRDSWVSFLLSDIFAREFKMMSLTTPSVIDSISHCPWSIVFNDPVGMRATNCAVRSSSHTERGPDGAISDGSTSDDVDGLLSAEGISFTSSSKISLSGVCSVETSFCEGVVFAFFDCGLRMTDSEF